METETGNRKQEHYQTGPECPHHHNLEKLCFRSLTKTYEILSVKAFQDIHENSKMFQYLTLPRNKHSIQMQLNENLGVSQNKVTSNHNVRGSIFHPHQRSKFHFDFVHPNVSTKLLKIMHKKTKMTTQILLTVKVTLFSKNKRIKCKLVHYGCRYRYRSLIMSQDLDIIPSNCNE